MLSKGTGTVFNLLGAEVLNQLAHMRQQLQQERQRVENALTKQKVRSCVSVLLSTFAPTDTYSMKFTYSYLKMLGGYLSSDFRML